MADIISALGVLVAAITFAAGVSAWKREFIGERRIELAESVLAQFYEAEDAVKDIRNPFSFVGEGNTRQRSEGERQEESTLLDQAYVVFERYKRHEKLFSHLRSMRYQCMATFGPKAAEPFNELFDVMNKIFSAARMLGSHYWPRQGRVQMTEKKFQEHLDGMHKHEAVFWSMGNDEDTIAQLVRAAVAKMEVITKDVVADQMTLMQKFWAKVKKRVRSS